MKSDLLIYYPLLSSENVSSDRGRKLYSIHVCFRMQVKDVF